MAAQGTARLTQCFPPQTGKAAVSPHHQEDTGGVWCVPEVGGCTEVTDTLWTMMAGGLGTHRGSQREFWIPTRPPSWGQAPLWRGLVGDPVVHGSGARHV